MGKETTIRRQMLLDGLDPARLVGLEIGALASPVVTPSDGEIIYVDRAGTDELRERYASDPAVDASKIVPVDIVWRGTTLLEALGTRAPVDYVVASHVAEHVPDLISWLGELHAVLKADGRVYLAVPDRRHTFDYLRRESELVDALNAFVLRAQHPLPVAVLDFNLNAARVDLDASWSPTFDPADLERFCSPEAALELARDVVANGTYSDVHCWVFTPESFVHLLHQAALLGLVPFTCETFRPTARGQLEFFVTLRACTDRGLIRESWAGLAEATRYESGRVRAERLERELARTVVSVVLGRLGVALRQRARRLVGVIRRAASR